MMKLLMVLVGLLGAVSYVDAGCGKGFQQMVAITCKGPYGEKKLLAINPAAKECSRPDNAALLKVCKSKFWNTWKASMNTKYTGCYSSSRAFWRKNGVPMTNQNFKANFPVIRTGFGMPRGTCFKALPPKPAPRPGGRKLI